MNHRIALMIVLGATLSIGTAQAQEDDMPAVGGLSQGVSTSKSSASTVTPSSIGTNIISEQESPIGLYIMPWRDSQSQADMDRPARLLQESLTPIDPQVFARRVDYYNALTAALTARGTNTPQ